jgi:hypothetical protein
VSARLNVLSLCVRDARYALSAKNAIFY